MGMAIANKILLIKPGDKKNSVCVNEKEIDNDNVCKHC